MNGIEKQRELMQKLQSAKDEEEKVKIKNELLALRRELRFTDHDGDCVIIHKS